MYYTKFKSPFCEIILVGNNDGLAFLHLDTAEGKRSFEISKLWTKNSKFFEDTKTQLIQYFKGQRKVFDVKLNAAGTPFQKTVWQALTKIPYGQTSTYKDIATAIGNEKAYRAVGMANNKNPIPIIVPCHRVIGANGKLIGFAKGLEIKSKLLRLESQNNE